MITAVRMAPAKINLTLRVTGVRSDGYHEIESLVARVGLHDIVSATPRTDGQFTLRCDDPAIPVDDRNLVLRAARELADAAGRRDVGADLLLEKRIPAGAGLGGGSSDAAAALSLLNGAWALGFDRHALAGIAARIGSDVPLFFAGPVCVLCGRGVEIEDVPVRLAGWIVLVLPEIHSATAAVYAAWDRLTVRPARAALDSVLAGLQSGLSGSMPALFNDLEAAAHSASSELGQFAGRLRDLAVAPFCMSGSGSAYFSLTDDESTARSIASEVRTELGMRAEAVPFATD